MTSQINRTCGCPLEEMGEHGLAEYVRLCLEKDGGTLRRETAGKGNQTHCTPFGVHPPE